METQALQIAFSLDNILVCQILAVRRLALAHIRCIKTREVHALALALMLSFPTTETIALHGRLSCLNVVIPEADDAFRQ